MTHSEIITQLFCLYNNYKDIDNLYRWIWKTGKEICKKIEKVFCRDARVEIVWNTLRFEMESSISGTFHRKGVLASVIDEVEKSSECKGSDVLYPNRPCTFVCEESKHEIDRTPLVYTSKKNTSSMYEPRDK